ncbi:hypothetical protein D8674_025958 [Pyrus ussuriensis x Pyrus communis]|uniref:Reverse transcriptase domain-containing protein n=1 Tax=Pyrus ussuriensis x Pyrus communis TaxID=2448454 RepID=A0A5N5IJR0_9ROSA|nr:hypothetical protein D8674_025958 [Pyrus ussuriensis x Pyrus communis]
MLDIIAAIHALGEAQKQIDAFVEELKNSIPKPIEKTPPYPISILHILYPKGYKNLNLVLFNGKKGSPKEHISRFIDVLGPYAGECNLRFKEFSKSLIDCAYTCQEMTAVTLYNLPNMEAVELYLSQEQSDETIGYIEIDLKISFFRSFTKFYVMDINVAYHALLGRPWINKHRLVAFTHHQCIKGRIGPRLICIPRNQMPFNLDKVHYSDAECYNDFLSTRTMTAIFHDLMGNEVEDYVDDLVVKSKTREGIGMLRRCFMVHQRNIDIDPNKQVVLEHIHGIINISTDALATLGSKLTFVKEQPNIVVIRKEALTIDSPFLELSKPSEELNIKCIKKYINVIWTLYKRLFRRVLT